MRDAIAGAWLYSLVLIFMVILVAFVSISINYNKTYKLKTAVVNLIEQNQGVNAQTVASIGTYLNANGYNSRNICREVVTNHDKSKRIHYVGILQNAGEAKAVNQESWEKDDDVPQQHVCITRESFKSAIDGATYTDHYYNVYMFFNFSLPVFGNLIIFKVSGSTNSIYYPVDSYSW